MIALVFQILAAGLAGSGAFVAIVASMNAGERGEWPRDQFMVAFLLFAVAIALAAFAHSLPID